MRSASRNGRGLPTGGRGRVTKRRGRLFALILTGGLLLSLSGCGEGAPQEAPFLEEYDLAGVQVRAVEEKTLTVGGADFEAMALEDGETSLPYRLHMPVLKEGQKAPVLLFFHGAGERGTDNRKTLLTYRGMKTLFAAGSPLEDAIILVPQCPVDGMWVELPDDVMGKGLYSLEESSESPWLAAALKLVKYYVESGMADRDRVYVMGMSMGGYAAWDVLTRHPGLAAAAVPICGGCDPAAAESVLKTPIRTFHGDADPLVDPDGTRAMAAAVEELGGKCFSYTEYAERGHNIWDDVMALDDLAEWLMAQSLSKQLGIS